jgi:HSP20 family molecular chaperone IbpA
MNGYPRDIFDEMDEVFTRLFYRMQENAFPGNLPASGYRIVIRNDDYPVPEPAGPALQASTLPEPEVHRIDHEVKVIAELPGAVPESISLDLQGSQLVIAADGPAGPYHTIADLPPVETGSLQKTFRNGVLEVTFHVLPGQAASA